MQQQTNSDYLIHQRHSAFLKVSKFSWINITAQNVFYSINYHISHFIPCCYHVILWASADLKYTEIYSPLNLGHFLSAECAASKGFFLFFTLTTSNSTLSVSSLRSCVFCGMEVSAFCTDEDQRESVFCS